MSGPPVLPIRPAVPKEGVAPLLVPVVERQEMIEAKVDTILNLILERLPDWVEKGEPTPAWERAPVVIAWRGKTYYRCYIEQVIRDGLPRFLRPMLGEVAAASNFTLECDHHGRFNHLFSMWTPTPMTVQELLDVEELPAEAAFLVETPAE